MANNTYSKKVIDHFRNPRNYGKMKNPDGVGKVGNPVCLLPHQSVHINSNLKEINKISKEDSVLSHDRKYNSVERIIKRKYKGKILSLKNKLGRIDITPDHLVLAISVPNKLKFLRTKNKKKLIGSWYHAKDLKKGDIIFYPILKEEKDLKYLEIDIPKPKWDFKSKNLPEKIPLNFDLLRLFGYFLSEGNVQDKPCKTYISFSFNIKEKNLVEDVKKISKRLFGLDVTIRELPHRNTVVVSIYSARLARFFKQLFDNGAERKSIPGFIMTLPIEKQKSLIYGLWKGDGYINLDRDGPRAGYSTISHMLAQQIKVLLLRQKIAPSIYAEKEKKVKGVNHKKAYRIHVGQRDSLLRLCSILNVEYKPRSYVAEKAWFDDNYLYIPITEVKKKRYSGNVYNIEVQKSKSFTSEAFCLHNCGDVMHLYIKVEKGIIKDIKYETFGCVAAISTSSIVTDLAKGKTLKQALKIDSNKVVKSLGGLPDIKHHCSLLAVDALKKAIDDYLSKKKDEEKK